MKIEKKLSESLQFVKDISRKVEVTGSQREIDRIRNDVKSGLKVGFFINGQPFVARKKNDSENIEVVRLEE